MTDFPNNFDYVIYGTGVTESILASSLSVIGKHILHIDKNSYYGGYNGCLRLVELENILNEWKEIHIDLIDNERNIFNNNVVNATFIELFWHVKKEENIEGENGLDSDIIKNSVISEEFLRQKIRGFEFELIPKLVYCESETVDALIQSDVTRYLEFKFVSKFASINDDQIINIPINRSDIVKTRVFSLRQKRQLTSFLEWCFNATPEDAILTKYTNRPLYELMRSEKNIDLFTENIIIQCLALSSPNVEAIEGTMQIKRLLKSFNKFGPYPIMWPNYGSGEIPQAFCRMAAVFGGIYCLNTSIQSYHQQDMVNGIPPSDQVPDSVIPISHRKIKLKLSNDNEVYTDQIICNKSYLNPFILINADSKSWVCRAILITNRSLLNTNRESNDILLLPLQLQEIIRPVVLIELPIERRGDSSDELFVVHITGYSTTCLSAKELFANTIGTLFDRYNCEGPPPPMVSGIEVSKPSILFECYFTLPDYTNVTVDTASFTDISHNTVFVNSSLDNFEFEDCIKEARTVFSKLCPGEQFLPRPPNPEDIILLGDDTVAVGAPVSGDFPFADPEQAMSPETSPAGPGDVAHDSDSMSSDQRGTTVSGLLAELDLEASHGGPASDEAV